MALSTFDQLSVGIVLVDRSARVLFANAAAEALSEDGGPLRLNSSITAISAEHTRRLGDLIRSALGGTLARSMSLPSSGSGRPLMVVVAPLRRTEPDRSDIGSLRTAAAMLLVCDPDRPAHIPVAWMIDAYGLTAGETRVALAIASGATIPDTARRLEISVNTVKTHLRRVYDKTGTNRQAELSRLMATISLARAPRA